MLWSLDLKWCDTLPQNLPQMSVGGSEQNSPLVIVVSPWAISAGCQFPLIRFFSSCSCSWVDLSQKSNDDIWLLFSLPFPRGAVQLNLTLSPSYVYLIEPPREGDTCTLQSCCPQQSLTNWFINSHKCLSRVLLGFPTILYMPKITLILGGRTSLSCLLCFTSFTLSAHCTSTK